MVPFAPGAVLHRNRDAEDLRHLLSDDARHDVARSAGREADQESGSGRFG
jgi:hypothetical protein